MLVEDIIKKAIFLDRDGVIIKDKGILTRFEEVEYMPEIDLGLALLKERGFNLILVTNQTAAARGLCTLEEVQLLNSKIILELTKKNELITFDGIYISPFHPNAQVESLRKGSDCRKPRAGMLARAIKEHNLNVEHSYLIGDRLTDIYAGNTIGCKSIWLKSGKDQDPFIEFEMELDEKLLVPWKTCSNFKEVIDFIDQDLKDQG